jgi:hypothetical protein
VEPALYPDHVFGHLGEGPESIAVTAGHSILVDEPVVAPEISQNNAKEASAW